jgi:hypothetical protein
MQTKVLVIAMCLFSFIRVPVHPQGDCEVLIPKIGDFYTGPCKNGLADGTGEAFGVDQYTGDFRKGLPHGIGTYIWHTGDRYEGSWEKGLRSGYGIFTMNYLGRDSILAGVWKKDRFIGKDIVPDYAILYRQGVGRVTCMKMGKTPTYIKLKFTRSGEASAGVITELLLTGSSGSESITDTMTGFEHIDFPFEGRVTFNAPNAFYSAILSCDIRFVVNKPGAWTVTIYY